MVGFATLAAIPVLSAGIALAAVALVVLFFLAPPKKDHLGTSPEHHAEDPVLLFRAGCLADANTAGLSLLSGTEEKSWDKLASLLSARFPEFPRSQGTSADQEIKILKSSDPEDQSVVTLEQWDDCARVRLHCKNTHREPPPTEVFDHGERQAPYPIWQTQENGEVVWANSAYIYLARMHFPEITRTTIPILFDRIPQNGDTIRTIIKDSEQSEASWFDVTSRVHGGSRINYAVNADAIVDAEIAQRNFVQTLTKTFAQLSIGLAIFDRNRQLTLFNPALIDLTALPADFLSSRPNLLSFFDRLRENQMLPEPKNYSSWREQIAELVVAAADDRYCETWSLPSDITYRVNGRPHPDGAIALLFEDISAEVSLTRRFRSELELSQSVLDSMDEAVVVFSPLGTVSFTNSAYQSLWHTDPDTSFADYTAQDALHQWQSDCAETDQWPKLRKFLSEINPQYSHHATVSLKDGSSLTLHASGLNGGFKVVRFLQNERRASQGNFIEMEKGLA